MARLSASFTPVMWCSRSTFLSSGGVLIAPRMRPLTGWPSTSQILLLLPPQLLLFLLLQFLQLHFPRLWLLRGWMM
jgi:hypothetical protein